MARIKNPDGFGDSDKKIEDVKQEVLGSVLSVEEFTKKRNELLEKVNNPIANEEMAFRATGIPGRKHGRKFHVVGYADPKFIYRGAKMEIENKTYYFLGSSYDLLYRTNDHRQLTIIAWIKIGKRFEQSPISKNEIKNVVTMPIDESKAIHTEITKSGGNPLL